MEMTSRFPFNAFGDVLNDATHTHDRAVLALVRKVAVYEMPRLFWMRRCRCFDGPIDDWFPRLEHQAELRHDTNRNVFKHLVDGIPEVCFHRKAIDAG